MRGALLAKRADVEKEFVEALASEDPATQRAAVEFVAQLKHMPEWLEAPILEGVREALKSEPVSAALGHDLLEFPVRYFDTLEITLEIGYSERFRPTAMARSP